MTARNNNGHSPSSPIFSLPPPRLFSIPAGRPFLSDLAAALMRDPVFAATPVSIAEAEVFVPNRRAARMLPRALYDAIAGDAKAMLAPRIHALGDLPAPCGEALPCRPATPNAIAPARRLLLLAALAGAYRRAQGAPGAAGADLAHARSLAQLLDAAQTEEISLDALETLAPDAFAEHWRRSLDFLKIVTEHWPSILRDEAKIDPAERRRIITDSYVQRWAQAPPERPVIAAGSTGAAPSAARLLRTIANAPQGCVVLPGLDLEMDDAAWRAVDQSHSQYAMKKFLDRAGFSRSQVRVWPGSASRSNAARRRFLSLALRPAPATADWRDLADALRKRGDAERGVEGMAIFQATDDRAEALGAALLLKSHIETEDSDAALVTPDRQIARAARAHLEAWGVAANDTAGTPLPQSPIGRFLIQTARAALDPHDPGELIGLMKNPLAALNMEPGECGALGRDIEYRIRSSRGKRPSPSRAAAEAGPAALHAYECLRGALAPLRTALEKEAPFYETLAENLRACELIAAASNSDGAARLWAGEEGARAARELRRLLTETQGAAFAGDYIQIFRQMTEEISIGADAAPDARIAIYGALESRFIDAGLVVLSGLNEGVWPSDRTPDPWLSRAMRDALGLPLPEWLTGRAAHDFESLASRPRVMLSFAQRRDGADAAPSRWIRRVLAVANATGLAEKLDKTPELSSWIAAYEAPSAVAPAPPPEPRPPAASRPRKLSVTEIEKLIRDPYAVYARKVLGLRPLDPLKARSDSALYGELAHEIMHRFAQAAAGSGSEQELAAALGREADIVFGDSGAPADIVAFWRARFLPLVPAIAGIEANLRSKGASAVLESSGEIEIMSEGGAFTLNARADRIDRLSDGGFAVYDYKTGASRTKEQVRANLAPQLPLEAAIAAGGGFGETLVGPPRMLAYILLTQSGDGPGILPIGEGAEAEALTSESLANTIALLSLFDDPNTPYLSQPRIQYLDDYGDYDHLARRAEWRDGGGGPK